MFAEFRIANPVRRNGCRFPVRRRRDLAVVIENQAAYLAGWLRTLRDDRKLLIYAAAQAQKAADFILGRRSAGI
jgi:antirestriction protein ArdC